MSCHSDLHPPIYPPAKVPASAPVRDTGGSCVSSCHSGQQDICLHRAAESRQRHGLRIKPSRKQCGMMKLSISPSPACPVTVLTVGREKYGPWAGEVGACRGTREHTHTPQSRSAELQEIIGALGGTAYVFWNFPITSPSPNVNILFYRGLVAFHKSKNVNTMNIYPQISL